MVLMRGLRVHAPVLRWQRETVAPAESIVSHDFVREGTQLAIAEMLRAGITAFSDSYRFPEEAARAAAEARVRAVIGLPVSEGRHFLLDTGTVNVLSAYREAPAIRPWNAPVGR